MSSNCDSEGYPIDHDGHRLEDGTFTSETPFAIRGDIFCELFSGSGKDTDVKHLDVDSLGGFGVKPSSTGGIPVLDGFYKMDSTIAQEVKKDVSVDDKLGKPKSWANVLKTDIPVNVAFKYYPVDKGVTLVQPPDEELLKGINKFKNCVVGTFSKGTHSYKAVSEFAFQVWKSRGLLSVYQKDVSTYIFRFSNEIGMNDVLARGTWYISRRPLIVTAWGHKPGSSCISTMPLWVKFSNVPDCYWTEEGLGRLASVIGEPIGADDLTSKLELLPFAKMQIRYKLGDPLPNEIQASVLDPVSKERSVVNVSVTYPIRPLFCSGCSSLGHSTSACPKVSRVWVMKEKPSVTPIPENKSPHALPKDTVLPDLKGTEGTEGTDGHVHSSKDEWTEVKRKKSGPSLDSEASPSPPVTFRNLKIVDEIDIKKNSKAIAGPNGSGNSSDGQKRLMKTQKKRLKASRGSDTPSLS